MAWFRSWCLSRGTLPESLGEWGQPQGEKPEGAISADPASSNCKDSSVPLTPGAAFQNAARCGIYFLFMELPVCSRQPSRHYSTGGPVPVPLLQITGNLQGDAHMLMACHSLPAKQIHFLLRFLSELGIFSSILEGENNK